MPDPAEIPVTPVVPAGHPAVATPEPVTPVAPVEPVVPVIDPMKGLQETVQELTDVVANQAQIHANEMAQLRQTMATPQIPEPTPTPTPVVGAVRELTPEELEGMTSGERINYQAMRGVAQRQETSDKNVADLLGQVSDARSRSQMANTASQANTDIATVVIQDRYAEPYRKPVNDIIVGMLETEVVQALQTNPAVQISRFDIQRRFGEINAQPSIVALLDRLKASPPPAAPVTPQQAQQIVAQRGASVEPAGSGAPATEGDERPVTLADRRDRLMGRFDNMVPRGQ